eukprot:1386430-Amorphochlora_amoeboformis.AAC.1
MSYPHPPFLLFVSLTPLLPLSPCQAQPWTIQQVRLTSTERQGLCNFKPQLLNLSILFIDHILQGPYPFPISLPGKPVYDLWDAAPTVRSHAVGTRLSWENCDINLFSRPCVFGTRADTSRTPIGVSCSQSPMGANIPSREVGGEAVHAAQQDLLDDAEVLDETGEVGKLDSTYKKLLTYGLLSRPDGLLKKKKEKQKRKVDITVIVLYSSRTAKSYYRRASPPPNLTPSSVESNSNVSRCIPSQKYLPAEN